MGAPHYCLPYNNLPSRASATGPLIIETEIMKKEYEIPVAEELVVLQETAFLTGSDVTGRADNGYEDNEMEGL